MPFTPVGLCFQWGMIHIVLGAVAEKGFLCHPLRGLANICLESHDRIVMMDAYERVEFQRHSCQSCFRYVSYQRTEPCFGTICRLFFPLSLKNSLVIKEGRGFTLGYFTQICRLVLVIAIANPFWKSAKHNWWLKSSLFTLHKCPGKLFQKL